MHDAVKNVLQDLTQLTDDELRKINAAVIDQLKLNRNANAVAKRHTLSTGDRVSWTGRNGYTEGTIVRVKRKKAICDVGLGRNWDVPLGMLTAV
jgi:hypothetical protein|tara:strand:- start:93 stop:374 length:282 start_codon:yes stop_codon:yes gene_type:complete